MPITFNCPCGKALRVADENAGRRVKCPACQAVGSVPAPEPQFEVVEDEPKPAPAKAKPLAKPAVADDDDDDDARGYTVAKKEGRDDEDEPRAKEKPDFRKGSGRRAADYDDDEDDDRPKKKKKKAEAQKNTGGSLEGKVFNGGVGVGILAMVGAVVWFVVGIVALDVIFFYPPILFIIGLVAFFKGLMGRE